jgi:hypothetical protein
MTTQPQSPYNELPYHPARLRMPRPEYAAMSDKRRAMFASYTATRDYLAGIVPRPSVLNGDAVAMWEREVNYQPIGGAE